MSEKPLSNAIQLPSGDHVGSLSSAADVSRVAPDPSICAVKTPSRLFVIYARCTHLGCTPDWKQSENKFKCPCHGSGYDSEGVNFEGPAPRPMDRAHIELDATGQIVVDTNRLYLQDLKAGKNEFDRFPGAYLVV